MQAQAYRVIGTSACRRVCRHAQLQKHRHRENMSDPDAHRHEHIEATYLWYLQQLTFVGCLPRTRHCAGHHTHVTSLEPPKHLPTTSEASSIVIPILQMKKVRHREVGGHATRARAGVLTQFCLTWESSPRSTRPRTHPGKHIETRNAQIHEHIH